MVLLKRFRMLLYQITKLCWHVLVHLNARSTQQWKVKLRVSVCGEYTLFINEKYVSSNQYADYVHYKVYDEILISEFLINGKNSVYFLVWYFGKSGMRYNTPVSGLIYEIIGDNNLISFSSVNTLSRKSNAYKSGEKKKISSQLGFSFSYDSTKEDNWLDVADETFGSSFKIAEKAKTYINPIKNFQ